MFCGASKSGCWNQFRIKRPSIGYRYLTPSKPNVCSAVSEPRGWIYDRDKRCFDLKFRGQRRLFLVSWNQQWNFQYLCGKNSLPEHISTELGITAATDHTCLHPTTTHTKTAASCIQRKGAANGDTKQGLSMAFRSNSKASASLCNNSGKYRDHKICSWRGSLDKPSCKLLDVCGMLWLTFRFQGAAWRAVGVNCNEQ